jgi:hypothetical protein
VKLVHPGPSREPVVDTMIELTRLSNLHRAIVAGGDSLELHLHSCVHHGDLPHSKGAAFDRPDRGSEFADGDRSCPNPDIAVPLHQRGHRGLDRFARKWLLPESPHQTGTDGLSDRSGCQVPAGPRAFSAPTEFWSDGKRGVKSDDPTDAQIAGAIGRVRRTNSRAAGGCAVGNVLFSPFRSGTVHIMIFRAIFPGRPVPGRTNERHQ